VTTRLIEAARGQLRAAVVRVGEIPNVVSELVGRDREIARVRALLEATRGQAAHLADHN
jgi:hypothetical protein